MNDLVDGKVVGKTKMPTTNFDEIIDRLKELLGVSTDKDLANRLGKVPQTISAARSKQQIPKPWYTILSLKYGLSEESLGMTPDLDSGARMKMGQLQMPLGDSAGASGPSPPRESHQIKIHEDMALAAEVLESKTPYAVALHLNIHQFAKAVRETTRNEQLQNQISAQAETICDLKEDSMRMKKKMEELESKLARLLATGGDPKPEGEVA
jgi:hypothetical protein